MWQRRGGKRDKRAPSAPSFDKADRKGSKGKRRPQPLVTERQAPKRAKVDPDLPPPVKRSKIARHPVVIALNFAMLVLVVGLVGAIAGLVLGRNAYMAPGPLQETVQLNIPRGASVQSIAQGLEWQGIISNQYVFMAAAYGTGATRDMKAGEYIIPANASMANVLDKIVSGEVVQHAVTVPEGYTSTQVVNLLNENEVLSGSIRDIPPEGSLLPETYSVVRGMSRERVLQMMRDARESALAEIWESRDPDIPVETPEDLVILASIIEKETGQADERDRVAGVFVNRLRQRMRLQSDPTILYGIYGGKAWSEPRTIFRSDLERPNSYNTYQIAALPPGPIANPGREALQAAANPAETEDLFFVADGTGGHAFARTYEEHQVNVARWREIEAARRNGSNQQNTQ
ncbi:MAG: endolytic transglycosylase MltG [Pseudomonadota bacterium]